MCTFLTCALFLALGGCDLFGQRDTTIAVTGRAVTAGGEPIVGRGVSLNRSVTLGSVPDATTTTDGRGAVFISFDPGDVTTLRDVEVNSEPYDSRYSLHRESLVPGERRDLGDLNLSLPAAP